MASSVQKALSATSLPLPSVEAHYGPFIALVARLLGAPPKVFLSLAHASPLTITFVLGAFRMCFRAPYCDLHILRITPEHRRTALLESSLTHHCPYCVGHAVALGDMLRGPVVRQCARRGDKDLTRSPGEETLTRLVREVCGFPGSLTQETKAAFLRVHGDDGFAQIAAMVSFMGWLNFTMSATGMGLESRLLPFVELSLEEKRIQCNLRDTVLDDGEEHMGEAEVSNMNTPMGIQGWVGAHFANVVQCFQLVGPIVRALLAEREWFAGIPDSEDALDAWCVENVGVLLGVFKNVDEIVLKRAMALGLRLVFVEECVWTRVQRCVFMYVFAVGVGSCALREDAVVLYKACFAGDGMAGTGGMTGAVSQLEDAVAVARGGEAADAFSAGLMYVHACAGPGEGVTEDVVERLLRFVKGHRDIVDLAGMIGYFGFLNRAAVLYPGES